MGAWDIALRLVDLLDGFQHIRGNMHVVPVLLDGDTDSEPLKSKLILCEDGKPLRRAHEQHDVVAGLGRGAYSHWGRLIYFSTSDNTDPNRNGRVYSYAIDHSDQHAPKVDGRIELRPPFYVESGRCWGIAVDNYGDDAENAKQSRMRLFEDDLPLGPAHAMHADINRAGSGLYSHWCKFLYFSTSDGSDPNLNGRIYRYAIEDAADVRAEPEIPSTLSAFGAGRFGRRGDP